jgi:hypothetical protein
MQREGGEGKGAREVALAGGRCPRLGKKVNDGRAPN